MKEHLISSCQTTVSRQDAWDECTHSRGDHFGEKDIAHCA